MWWHYSLQSLYFLAWWMHLLMMYFLDDGCTFSRCIFLDLGWYFLLLTSLDLILNASSKTCTVCIITSVYNTNDSNHIKKNQLSLMNQYMHYIGLLWLNLFICWMYYIFAVNISHFSIFIILWLLLKKFFANPYPSVWIYRSH